MPKTLPHVKEDILKCTREMIRERGAGAISMREIAKTCGIATGTFYNYFNSKQDILLSLMESDWQKMSARIQNRLNDHAEPLESLEFIFMELKRMMHDVHTIWAEGFSESFSGAMTAMHKMKQRMRDEYTGYIKSCISGHFPEDKIDFAADFITRTFFTYAYDENVEFSSLGYLIQKLLD